MSELFPLMSEAEFLRSERSGLAFDIDETLAWTVRDWAERIFAVHGNDTGMSVEEFVLAHPHDSFFPERYRTPEIRSMTAEFVTDNEFQKNITPVPWALETIRATKLKAAAYVTARPDCVYAGTAAWFERNGYEPAPVIMRPSSVPHGESTAWKARLLLDIFPKISGIVDDSHSLAQKLEHRYDGTLFLINPIRKQYVGKAIRQFSDWREFHESIIGSQVENSK